MSSKCNDEVSSNLNSCLNIFPSISSPHGNTFHTIFMNKQMNTKTASFRKCTFWTCLTANSWFGGHFDLEWPLTALQYVPTKSNLYYVKTKLFPAFWYLTWVIRPTITRFMIKFVVSGLPPPSYFDHFWLYLQITGYAFDDPCCQLRVKSCPGCPPRITRQHPYISFLGNNLLQGAKPLREFNFLYTIVFKRSSFKIKWGKLSRIDPFSYVVMSDSDTQKPLTIITSH